MNYPVGGSNRNLNKNPYCCGGWRGYFLCHNPVNIKEKQIRICCKSSYRHLNWKTGGIYVISVVCSTSCNVLPSLYITWNYYFPRSVNRHYISAVFTFDSQCSVGSVRDRDKKIISGICRVAKLDFCEA